ncbi:MAG TPA: DedA family protein [Gemmatimonadaceae bacterium]|nr:DedA family protein [Gemmatimonadaceae bacterium]
MQGLLDWLAGLPSAALLGSLAIVAAAENIFPPLPADTVVAFGAFLAARGQVPLLAAFLATWLGNVAGAILVYALGRRYGARYAHQWMSRFGGATNESRLESMYERRGMLALFLSRFIPGLRALVPPFAGAIRVPALPATLAIAVASGIWYGIVTWIAYRVGSDWEALQQRLRGVGVTTAVAALGIAIIVGGWYLIRRRRAAS